MPEVDTVLEQALAEGKKSGVQFADSAKEEEHGEVCGGACDRVGGVCQGDLMMEAGVDVDLIVAFTIGVIIFSRYPKSERKVYTSAVVADCFYRLREFRDEFFVKWPGDLVDFVSKCQPYRQTRDEDLRRR